VAVAAVQGGGARGYTGQDADPSVVFAAQLRASTAVPAGTRLVVWPEDVIALGRPLAGSPQAALMAGLARHLGATVVAGVTVTQDGGRFFNQAVAWGPTGRVVGTYEKVHRVPFGEYVPWRGLFSHLVSLSGVPDDAVPGHGSGLLDTPAGPLGLMVSYEVFYADRGRSATRAGAELLVVPTNTASYASSQVPTEEVAADRVQAVAEGRDLVQAATTGFSTVVDNRGRVLGRSTLGAPAVVASTVALRNGATLYERAGDLPVLVLAALALAGSWVAERRRRRAPDEDPAAEGPGTAQEPAVSVGQPA
jgi:apolipoprotein N-acyltransferase